MFLKAGCQPRERVDNLEIVNIIPERDNRELGKVMEEHELF